MKSSHSENMLLSVAFGILVTLLLAFAWKIKLLKDSLPPGPTPLPVFGNLLHFDKDVRQTMLKWHKQYGPMYTVWIGMRPKVYITGYQLIYDTMVKRADEFVDRPHSFVFQYFTGGKYGIIATSGEQMKEQRRFTLQVLRSFGFGKKTMEEKILVETQKLLNAIQNRMQGELSKVISVQGDLELCIGNIISSLLVGRVYEEGNSTFRRLKNVLERKNETLMNSTVLLMNSFPWLRFMPFFMHFGFDDIQKEKQEFLEIIQEELDRHKRDFNATAEPTDFTAAYLQELLKREKNGDIGYFSEWQLISIIVDLWSAGMETTVTTLGWAILLMMKYPQVQTKVHEELDLILGKEHQPSLIDKNQLPYTNAVLQEIQRYANITPGNFSRLLTKDTLIDGIVLPAGTTVVPQTCVVLIDDTIFCNAHEFNPDRFLTDEKSTKYVAEMVPFSLGKRSCLGESLARAELFIIFTCLMQKFQFSAHGHTEPSLEPKVNFLATAHPYECLVTSRI